jgi:carbonic anhydrase
VCRTTVVADAWARGQQLTIHGWTYGVHDGRLRNMGMMIGAQSEIDPVYRSCVAGLSRNGAHTAENDVLASDAARLGDVPAVIQKVIKEMKHE